jgi:23S rRNA pseudouridine955/2504/2580 synthase
MGAKCRNRTTSVQQIEVLEEDGEPRLDRWLRRRFPDLSQGKIEKMLRKGAVRVDGSRAKAADRLQPGQKVRIPPMPSTPAHFRRSDHALSDEDIAFIRATVLFRDDAMIVLNKPPGLPVQGGTGQTSRHVDGLLDGLKFARSDRPRLTHRIDKDTSGVLLLARTPKAAAAMTKAFQSRTTRKIYWAAVMGVPTPSMGTIKTGLIKSGGVGAENVRTIPWDAVKTRKGAKRAVSDFVVRETLSGRASWVVLRPVTGRTHQLRAHMSALGCPIVGDGKYQGDAETVHLGGAFSKKMHLHARTITLPHPETGELCIFEAPLPDHMLRTWHAFGWEPNHADPQPFAVLDDTLNR